MKTLKKITALVSSLAIMASMAISVSAATLVDPTVTLSSTVADNTVTIKFNTTETTMTSGAAFVLVPDVLQEYIDSWEWSTPVTGLGITADTSKYVVSTKSNKSYISASFATGANGAQSVPGYYATLKITLKGEVPATVAEADRTIVMGGEHFSMTKYACYVGSVGYPWDENTAQKQQTKYWPIYVDGAYIDGAYVVVPTAAPVVTGPTYDGYVGDDDATDEAIGAIYDFTAPEAGAKGVKWTVETNDGVTKTRVSAVDVAGGATYKLGLVIQGLAESAVKSITAVLQ